MGEATVYIVLLVIAIVVLPRVLRFLLNAGVNQCSDATNNKIVEKKNEEINAEAAGPKRLADRYQGL